MEAYWHFNIKQEVKAIKLYIQYDHSMYRTKNICRQPVHMIT